MGREKWHIRERREEEGVYTINGVKSRGDGWAGNGAMAWGSSPLAQGQPPLS